MRHYGMDGKHDSLDGHCYEGCPCLVDDYVPSYVERVKNVSHRKRSHVWAWFLAGVVLAAIILY